MRVLFPFVGDSFGGSHLSALTLIKSLLNENIQPIIAVHQSGIFTTYLNQNNLNWVHLDFIPFVKEPPMRNQIRSLLSASQKIVKYLHKNDIDIVHTNDSRMHLTWAFGTKIAKKKMIWHQRNPHLSRRLDFFTLLSSEIITITEYCREQFPPLIKLRSTVVPNPIENVSLLKTKMEHKRDFINQLDVHPDSYVVGWVANWMDRKRPMIFVEMAEKLAKEMSAPICFAMFGEARYPYRELVIKKINDLGLNNCIKIMGVRTPIEPYIAGCDVLVATAVNEGFGRTLIESMLQKTVVVASAHGGHLEIIKNNINGILVPADKPLAFSRAVKRLLLNPEKTKRIVESAYTDAKINYSAEMHVKNILKIYQKILRPNG